MGNRGLCAGAVAQRGTGKAHLCIHLIKENNEIPPKNKPQTPLNPPRWETGRLGRSEHPDSAAASPTLPPLQNIS